MSQALENLLITAELASPIIIGGGFMTFDALLASIVFETTEDLEQAHNGLPLHRSGELFHASAAIMFPDAKQDQTFSASMRWDHDFSPDVFKKTSKGKLRKVSAKRKRDFGNIFNTYKSFVAPEILWYCEGDRSEIERLLANVEFIGKRRGSGFGQVKNWRVEPGEYDGLLGLNNNPLRPIPEVLYEGNDSALKIEASWKPPYWEPAHRAICYVPEFIK
jgi:hypothetical protein